MQPRTDVRFDERSFSRVKNSVHALVTAERRRRQDPFYASPIPVDIGVELTRRCNLRCAHCFLWNDEGFYASGGQRHASRDLDFDLLVKLLQDSAPARSNLFFWGAEPLLYPHWPELTAELERRPRWTVVCTNGTLVERNLDSLLRISPHLATVISVDGLAADHDRMRGPGCFDKVWRNIGLLLQCQKQGFYQGTISVHCVLNPPLIPHLYDFCCEVESLGVHSLYIAYPWYMPASMARGMDAFVDSKLSFLEVPQETIRSWHTYAYSLGAECLDELQAQVGRISARTWKVRFRFQPALEPDEIEGFVLGSNKPAQKRTACYAVANRVDVRADGTVTSCQCYPELVVGDLHRDDLLTIWHGDRFRRVREVVSGGLLPVCSRCILLYLNGK